MKRLIVLLLSSAVAVMVQFDCAVAQPKGSEEMVTPVKEGQAIKGQGVDVSSSMKQVLLNPKGFSMQWTCHGKSGISRVVFREDRNQLVVDIDNASSGVVSCTRDAKLTDDGVIFNGCHHASRDIPLAYDPGNKKTPFKGSKVGVCSSVELSQM